MFIHVIFSHYSDEITIDKVIRVMSTSFIADLRETSIGSWLMFASISTKTTFASLYKLPCIIKLEFIITKLREVLSA